jgi:hypothetical protein
LRISAVEAMGCVGAPTVSGLHRGAKFLVAISRHIDRIEIRKDAAASGQLDLTGALHQLLAHRPPHFVVVIRHPGKAELFDKVGFTDRTASQNVEGTIISVAAGL